MSDWAMVALTTVYVIATILICYFNYRSAKVSKEQAEEMHRQYDAENRPYITAELIYERKSFYGLRFTNHGRRIANHVSIQLEQGFLDSIIEPTFKSLLEKQKGRECIIGIGQHYDLFFGTNKFRNNSDKAPIAVHLAYSNGEKTYSDDLHIDFDTYATFFSVNSDTDEMLKEMKTQAEELRGINEALTFIASKTSKKPKVEDK